MLPHENAPHREALGNHSILSFVRGQVENGRKQALLPLTGLRLHTLQEKLNDAVDPFAQIVWPRKVDGPAPNNSCI